MKHDRIFIGRQPIVDENQSIHGYELLFRDNNYNNIANIKDRFSSIAVTLVNIFQNFGIDLLLNNSIGFLNTNREFLLSDYVELIPKEKIVLEILEDTIVDDYILNRISHLKSIGYKFALDDFIFDSEYIHNFVNLLDKVDYIKVEYPRVKNENLSLKLKMLKKLPAKLLAEKVETYSEFLKCKDAGFHLFQGFFFARPTILESEAIDPSQLTVIKIINMINKGDDVGKIVDVFHAEPVLSFNFLKFVNSSKYFFRSRIKSIRHAISLIGLKKLQSWLMLLSFVNNGKNGFNSPLFQFAVVRAKTLELLASKVFENNNEIKETAFLVGLLSFIDVLYGRPKDELIKMLALDEDVEKALLLYDGKLGMMLKALNYDEYEHYDDMLKILNKLNIEYEYFVQIKLKSYSWLNEFREIL